MKNLKFVLAAVMASFCLGASAQFTNSGGRSTSTSSANTDAWSSLYFQFNPSTMNIDVHGAKDQDFTGLLVGYSKAFSISSSIPLFIEAGGALEYSFYSEDEYGDGETNFSMLSIKVPVNVVYNYQFPNSTVALAPYAGLRLRANLLAKEKYEYGSYSSTVDLFDEDDMGKDYTWKRIQIGAQLGANVKFNNKFFVGAGYGFDFSEIAEKCTISEFSLTAGFIF